MQRWRDFSFLHGAICLYSVHTIIAKLVSDAPFLSFQFCILFFMEFAVLGIYAICWQKILKRFDLSVAYMNKAAVLLWSLVWNWLFFHDDVTASKLFGIFFVILGIIMLNSQSVSKNKR